MKNKITIGTRGSELALWQAHFAGDLLSAKFPGLEVVYKIIKTKGDKILDTPLNLIGGKGLFTKELEAELLTGSIDIAVHSLKDMPTELPDGLELSAVTERHSVSDVLVAKRKGYTLNTLPVHATIATGSLRRKSQLLWWRPDLNIVDLRGNINTRLRKFHESDWHGMVLAKAGLERLGFTDDISHEFTFNEMLPAVGQGALCIEARTDDSETKEILSVIEDINTRKCVEAERSFLRTLGGGCKTPIAAHCRLVDGRLSLDGLVASTDGKALIRDNISADTSNPEITGRELAERLLEKGADKLLTL